MSSINCDYANTSPRICLETREKLSFALASVDTFMEFTPSLPLTISSKPIALVFCGILAFTCAYLNNDLITLLVFSFPLNSNWYDWFAALAVK